MFQEVNWHYRMVDLTRVLRLSKAKQRDYEKAVELLLKPPRG